MQNQKNKTPFYAGKEFADLMKHDGGLLHAIGASSYQVVRANRSFPELAEGYGNTYNHAPMLTYWRGYFYLQYLSNPVHEHTGAGQSFLVKSKDGIAWDMPTVSFPPIKIPAGRYECADGSIINVPEVKDGFMHQRMGFYHTSDDRLIVSGFYGHAPHHDICPWKNFGCGRVVREIFQDGSMGEIYFIRYLDYSGWTEEKLPFPYYKEAKDKSFIAACEELLENRLVTEQWTEEHGLLDTTIGVKIEGRKVESGIAANTPFESASSFCSYHINQDTVIGLWKQGRVGRSDDGGKNFSIKYEPSFATSGAKAWGQKTADGRYALCYVNSLSSEHRYPLVAITSDDGIEYNDMACIFGELPPRRYDGTYKDFGPQYIRGICEGHKEYPEDALWLCHSVNKEDISVSRIPLPIKRSVSEHIYDNFEDSVGTHIKNWNIYSTKWAPVSAVKLFENQACMRIADKDPCDYARAMRIFPTSKKIKISMEIMSAEQYEENLEIELADKNGIVACRIGYGDGKLNVRYGSNVETAFIVSPTAQWHKLLIDIDCTNNIYNIVWDDTEYEFEGKCRLVNKVNDVERLIIRTKPSRYLPNMEIYPVTPDLENVDTPKRERIYFVRNVKTQKS